MQIKIRITRENIFFFIFGWARQQFILPLRISIQIENQGSRSSNLKIA